MQAAEDYDRDSNAGSEFDYGLAYYGSAVFGILSVCVVITGYHTHKMLMRIVISEARHRQVRAIPRDVLLHAAVSSDALLPRSLEVTQRPYTNDCVCKPLASPTSVQHLARKSALCSPPTSVQHPARKSALCLITLGCSWVSCQVIGVSYIIVMYCIIFCGRTVWSITYILNNNYLQVFFFSFFFGGGVTMSCLSCHVAAAASLHVDQRRMVLA